MAAGELLAFHFFFFRVELCRGEGWPIVEAVPEADRASKLSGSFA
jgi:hypothetical protein